MLWSCTPTSTKCETVQEWRVQKYRIVKSKCPDLVLPFHYKYEVFAGDNSSAIGASQVDSCVFTCHADTTSFLTLNVCDSSVHEIKPEKIPLEIKDIDSIAIFSKELNKTEVLTIPQAEEFVEDFNKSLTRGYSKAAFDSAFAVFPAYQYKLTVYTKGMQRPFYGYNYLILDSSRWMYEIGTSDDLKYFEKYWKHIQ